MGKIKPIKYRGPLLLHWLTIEHYQDRLDEFPFKDYAASDAVNGWYRIMDDIPWGKRQLLVIWGHNSERYQLAVFHGVLYFRYRRPQ